MDPEQEEDIPRKSPFGLGKLVIGLVVVAGVVFFARSGNLAPVPVTVIPNCDPVLGDTADCPTEDDENVPPSDEPAMSALPGLGDLVWSEDFDTLDPATWTVEHSTFGDGNSELQCYTPEQVSIESGHLVLTAENRQVQCPNGNIRAQTSGMLRTRALTLSPGQAIEWRVKLTPADEVNQQGLWPAVWSSSWAGGGWPTGGEWDGFEVMTANSPDRVSFGIHFSDQGGQHDKKAREVYGDRFSDDWHDFRFDYGLDGTLVWYMDGVETHRVTEASTLQGYPAPFDQTMTELRINLALGGNPGPLNPLALPATLEVDYIRAWSLS